MLILTRNKDESVVFLDQESNVLAYVYSLSPTMIRVGLKADPSIKILREELVEDEVLDQEFDDGQIFRITLLPKEQQGRLCIVPEGASPQGSAGILVYNISDFSIDVEIEVGKNADIEVLPRRSRSSG
jgi:sRNA-binding carbon storage regulator CsrA